MLQLTIAKNLHQLVILGNKTGRDQGLPVNPGVRGKPLKFLDINNGIYFLEDIIKAALWQPTLKRHLPAFKANLDAAARTGLVSLVTTGCRLTMTGTKPPAYSP